MLFLTVSSYDNQKETNLTKKKKVLDSAISPSTLLKIDYGANDVALGNLLNPQQTNEQPNIFFVAPEEDAYYTLIMVSPVCCVYDVYADNPPLSFGLDRSRCTFFARQEIRSLASLDCS